MRASAKLGPWRHCHQMWSSSILVIQSVHKGRRHLCVPLLFHKIKDVSINFFYMRYCLVCPDPSHCLPQGYPQIRWWPSCDSCPASSSESDGPLECQCRRWSCPSLDWTAWFIERMTPVSGVSVVRTSQSLASVMSPMNSHSCFEWHMMLIASSWACSGWGVSLHSTCNHCCPYKP